MAKVGEDWVKSILEERGYKLEKVGNEDAFGSKYNFGILVEEKDWANSVNVIGRRIWSYQKDGTKREVCRKQIAGYLHKIKQKDKTDKKWRHIVACYVFSNLRGRLVYPIYFGKYGTLFIVRRDFFPVWLKSIEQSYIGLENQIGNPAMYMGGK